KRPQDPTWKAKEQGEEARYAHAKEQEQLQKLREASQKASGGDSEAARQNRDYEAGFGGQEDLEDRYATTSGEH
ncbi:hypothetical protein BDW22DRAFT_1332124, partial [Trametopsis cervina]